MVSTVSPSLRLAEVYWVVDIILALNVRRNSHAKMEVIAKMSLSVVVKLLLSLLEHTQDHDLEGGDQCQKFKTRTGLRKAAKDAKDKTKDKREELVKLKKDVNKCKLAKKGPEACKALADDAKKMGDELEELTKDEETKTDTYTKHFNEEESAKVLKAHTRRGKKKCETEAKRAANTEICKELDKNIKDATEKDKTAKEELEDANKSADEKQREEMTKGLEDVKKKQIDDNNERKKSQAETDQKLTELDETTKKDKIAAAQEATRLKDEKAAEKTAFDKELELTTQAAKATDTREKDEINKKIQALEDDKAARAEARAARVSARKARKAREDDKAARVLAQKVEVWVG